MAIIITNGTDYVMFMERITKIFIYQMERKHGNSFKWKITYWLLNRMV
ncbi:MAG: hypothetical protein IJA36_12130 [Lachnospiraceae bacterium]|nr:hypothetical protein [Lachnospiraceae bacterium]